MRKHFVTLLALTLLFSACQETLEERCSREARDFTRKNCPMTVVNDVVMDSMTFDAATHTISYLYTLSGALDDAGRINNSNSRELLLQDVRNSTQLKLYKEAEYNFRYVYYSQQKKGTKLFEATFRKEDYR